MGDETEYIKLKFVGRQWYSNEYEIYLSVKLKEWYSSLVGVPQTNLMFLFNGKRIKDRDRDTPKALKMKQDDIIEVYTNSQWEFLSNI